LSGDSCLIGSNTVVNFAGDELRGLGNDNKQSPAHNLTHCIENVPKNCCCKIATSNLVEN